MLGVGDGQKIWWEEWGDRGGVPAVYLHGGPGGELRYDDVFTDGLNLSVVTCVLRRQGARRVCGVTLARQPRGGSSTVPDNTK